MMGLGDGWGARCRRRLAGATMLLLVVVGAGAPAESPPGIAVQERHTLVRATHARLLFDADVGRVATGEESVLGVDLLTSRELLVLGRGPGLASVTVWLADGSVEQHLFVVQRDLSVLAAALREIHPSLRVETAPDRDAVVLRGMVPDVSFSVAAEAAARSYLEAGGRGAQEPLLGGDAAGPGAESGDDAAQTLDADALGVARPGALGRRAAGRVINLIQVEVLPPGLKERLDRAAARVGGPEVRATRWLRGDVPGDEDVFVLEGEVADQRRLVRLLSVSALLVCGEAQEVEVRADESGALARRRGEEGDRGGGTGIPGLGGGTSSFQLETGDLSNRVRENIARASVLALCGGRLLSFVSVADLPQVRIAVRIYEVNRSRLDSWTPSIDAIAGDVDQGALLPTLAGVRAQGGAAAQAGGDDLDLQNAVSLLAGSFTNQLQVAGSRVAIDALFSLLADDGIARRLAEPTLMVLSGEIATFQVGGEIPVPTSVTTGAADRVFSSVFFAPFGIQLGVRPLVGDGDVITLDVTPQVVQPDPALTSAIRESTGQVLETTAFESRDLATTARLRDGQALVLGGLLDRSLSEAEAFTPWAHRIPGLGWLFRSFDVQDEDLELVIVVTPTILREPPARAALWVFPEGPELLPPTVPAP